MSTIVTGDPTQVSNSLSRNINGATNATPIVIQTTVSHLFQTGDHVIVDGVGGNTAANGEWVITVTDATHFELDGSVGNGAYTSGGTAVDVSLTPAGTLVSDGDGPLAAADVAPLFELLLHRTQFLALLAGRQWKRQSFTASGTWKCPPDVTFVMIEGVGGGGGGGGGGAQNSGDTGGCGGGGGGGSQHAGAILVVTPGTTYTVTVGAGGAGGAGGVNAAGADGSNGGHTLFNDGGTELFRAHGAAGGKGGSIGNGTTRKAVPGGAALRDLPGGTINNSFDVPTGILVAPVPYGQGGRGYNYPHAGSPVLFDNVEDGAPSPYGPGGAGGAAGADSSGSNAGGGGGGGGGGGAAGWPGTIGGAGGAGGKGSNDVDTNADPGSAGAQGTGPGAGAGGGGGGGTMAIAASGENGGAGAAGRDGILILAYPTRQP